VKSLLVFGSINLDLSMRVTRLPRAGETLMGHGAVTSPGGKGANQAHAACLMGSGVRLVGAVGDDELAEPAMAQLRSTGVDLSGVRRLANATTGLASIHVTDDGENAIVVSPGANQGVEANWVSDIVLGGCDTLLLQAEVPLAQSLILARRAMDAGLRVMLNLAPVRDVTLLEPGQVHVLIVNQGELAAVTSAWGMPELSGSDDQARARYASRRLQCDVVVTMGAEGAEVTCFDGSTTRIPAMSIPVTDTTGAGDTFCGVLAAGLNQGQTLQTALIQATAAAGLACCRPGAQISQPQRQDVLAALLRLPPG
jgi:ribokinase